ncbi:MAG: Ig-like domain-containing protein, partial [Actinomycetota bacterium]|nr:Ig-like domain-containing protein [Actinomycetota bacterium]
MSTSDTTPTLTGSAEANSIVTVLDGASPIGTATVDGSGAWSFTPATPLTSGPHVFTATATDAAGHTSPASSARTVTVDTAAPGAPTISTPATDVVTSSQTPLIAGSAEADSLVVIRDGASAIGSALADGTGAWSFTPGTPLNESAHVITATATDAAGNLGAASAPRTITVDLTNPGVTISSPAAGSEISDLTPDVVFSIADQHPGATTCSVDGGLFAACSSPYTTPSLTQGPHTVTVRHTDAAGNIGNASRSFIVDTIAPAAPVFTVPPADTIASSASGALEGTAEANSAFTLYYMGFPAGAAQTSASGNWIFPSVGIVVDGVYPLSGTATDAAGNESVQSVTRTITLDTTTPVVSITAPANGSRTLDTTPVVSFTVTDANIGTTECAVDGGSATACGSPFTTPELSDGAHEITVRHTDQAGNVGSAMISLVIDTVLPVVTFSAPAEGATLPDNTPEFVFSVSDSDPSTTTCAVDGGAAEPCASPFIASTLTDGPHSMTVSATDGAGNSGSATRNFTIDTGTPAAPTISTPATDISTNDTTPALIGNAEANSTVTIFDDADPIGTAVAGAGGGWSFTPSTPWSVGPHAITATATDAAGHASPASTVRTITVDLAAPPAPTITTPATNTVTSNQTPVIGGSAEANSIVTIRDGASSIGSVTAGVSGAWSFTPSTPLNESAHAITATATDEAGNTGPASAQRTITVDLTNPSVTISSPAPGSSIGDPTPDVLFSVADQYPGSSACAVDGAASTPCSSPYTMPSLTDGPHSITVSHVDQAGNSASSTTNFDIDTQAPAAPVITNPPADIVTSFSVGVLAGTAEAGSTVTGYLFGIAAGSTVADATGHWEALTGASRPEGTYVITATATDAAGNVSTFSESRTVVIDQTAPIVSITAPG